MNRNIRDCIELSKHRIDILRKGTSLSLDNFFLLDDYIKNICIYSCGSLAREEYYTTSDLDLFFIWGNENEIPKIYKYCFFSKLFEINRKLGFEDPSKFGEYWDFHSLNDLLDIGSQKEDYANCFTARLLLLLESKVIYNEKLYSKTIDKILDAYLYKFNKYKNNFLPMYLINDIIRYWYTLTLNYEFRVDDKDIKYKKYWKRLKLKYPRLLTCYSFIACLFDKNISRDYIKKIISYTPLERLQFLRIQSLIPNEIYKSILREYNWFLSLRQFTETWWEEDNNKAKAFSKADKFHELVAHELIKVVSENNKPLRNKLDF